MSEIVLERPFGDDRKKVHLSMPAGIAGEIWFITIDGYHRGQMRKQNGTWVCPDSPLTNLEIQQLGKIIDGLN